MAKKLGIIQSRGAGDIVIALPIARYYHQQGWEIHWPICEEFVSSFRNSVPWIKWIPIPSDAQGAFFWDVPMQRLRNFRCDEIICLYQALSGHPEFSARPEFQITKFDQFKYLAANVPFLNKWQLKDCITRDAAREQSLYNRIVKNPQYVVCHLAGSDYRASLNQDMIPEGWQLIEITPETDCIWDWLSILEGAQSLILVDSVFSNIVDQLNIGDDRYFIPRSHIHLTPVLGNDWTILEPDEVVKKRVTIFGVG